MSDLRTCFKKVSDDLPDIQRPFVWSSAKVRELSSVSRAGRQADFTRCDR